jgi:hypothetical protein
MINCVFGQGIDSMINDLNHYTFIDAPMLTRTIVDSGDNNGTGIVLRNTDFSGGKTWASIIGANSTFAGYVQATNGLYVRSNTLASIPTLIKGDAYFYSSNGVLYVITSSPSGVLATNKLAP